DRLGRDVVLADRNVQRIEIRVVELFRDVEQRRRVGQLLYRQPFLAQRLGQILAARLDRVDASLPGEPLADLGPGLGCADELQLVVRGPGTGDLAGEDLDGVARRERRVE